MEERVVREHKSSPTPSSRVEQKVITATTNCSPSSTTVKIFSLSLAFGILNTTCLGVVFSVALQLGVSWGSWPWRNVCRQIWKSIASYFFRYNFCTNFILSFWLSNGTYLRLFDNVLHFFSAHFWVFCCFSLLFVLQIYWPLLWYFFKFTNAASLCSFCC